MSQWIGNFRTNYFRVEDIDGLRKSLTPFEVDLRAHPDIAGVYRLSSTNEWGGAPSSTFDNDDNELEFSWENHVMPFLTAGEVLISMESGADGERYVTGMAEAWMREAKTGQCKSVYIDISQIHQLASASFGVPLENISKCEYVEFTPMEERSSDGAAIVGELTDERVDQILGSVVPGGSTAAHWFLPHESDKALNNIRDVIRAMIRADRDQLARDGLLQLRDSPKVSAISPQAAAELDKHFKEVALLSWVSEHKQSCSDAQLFDLVNSAFKAEGKDTSAEKIEQIFEDHGISKYHEVELESDSAVAQRIFATYEDLHQNFKVAFYIATKSNDGITTLEEPKLCLMVLSEGGVMQKFVTGSGPYEAVELIDCQNGQGGDTFEFGAEWEPILTSAFGQKSDWPSYVRIEGDEAAAESPKG